MMQKRLQWNLLRVEAVNEQLAVELISQWGRSVKDSWLRVPVGLVVCATGCVWLLSE